MAILNDAAEYFAALRTVLLGAERQVYVIGWDIHSQTDLIGPSGWADDGLPVKLDAFLKVLVRIKPALRINILIWDFAALYAGEREWNSAEKFTAESDGRIQFRLDACLPLGSAQHQKIVVIDNVVAFVGGLDLTIRRWDTSDHRPDHPLRRGPDGKPYKAFHDVQCMVDGPPAAALGEVARMRWTAAGGANEGVCSVEKDAWPVSVPAQVQGMTAGIARTELQTADGATVNEVARLFEASINAANNFIYIENQFISAIEIARLLAHRMSEVASLCVLIITPKAHFSWLESRAMEGGRGSFVEPFIAAGVTDRLRILYPSISNGQSSSAVMVHSKVMIVDDGFLRVGSANINNRSLGADSECDLALEATSEDHRDFIRNCRRRLIGHFCGLSEGEVAANEDDLLRFIDRHAAGQANKMLVPVERFAQAQALAALVETSRTIVVGDFNDWFWVKSVRRVLASKCPVRTRLRTFPSVFPVLRLDRIYATSGATILNTWTDRQAKRCSDHLPVLADIAFYR